MIVPAILGGKPIRTKRFPDRRPMGEREKRAALDVIASGELSAFIGGPGEYFLGGKKVREFEAAWARQSGYRHAISVNSWSAGLTTACGAVGVEPGDEVICSPYTMSASATCAMFYGGVPIFADIDPETFCLDPASVAQRVSDRTKAIVVVHLFGHPADMDGILAVARPRGIKVIEDAAQAPGVLYKGRPVGALGDIGGFSLNYHKHIHTGEGGMIVTNDDELARRCCLIRNHGENVLDDEAVDALVNIIGGNYRLTELQAAIGIEQLAQLDERLQVRHGLAAHLTERLAGLDGIHVQRVADGCTHAYYIYPFKYDAAVTGLSRHLFVRAVLAELPAAVGFEDTGLTEGYVKPLYLGPVFQKQRALGRRGFPFTYNADVHYEYPKGLCPVAERMHERELVLSPLVREPLTTADIDDLVRAITKVLESAAQIRAADSKQPLAGAAA